MLKTRRGLNPSGSCATCVGEASFADEAVLEILQTPPEMPGRSVDWNRPGSTIDQGDGLFDAVVWFKKARKVRKSHPFFRKNEAGGMAFVAAHS